MRTTSKTLTTLSRRESKKLSTRRDLILAGRKLLSSEGLYESRIEDITKHAGIAKGTLYIYFRNKEDLVLGVVSDGFEVLREYLSTRLESKQEPEEVASVIFAAHVEFFEEHPDLMRILHQVRGLLKFSRPEWRPLQQCLRSHLEFLSHQLARGEAASWSAARRRDLAILLFGSASGAASVLVSAYPKARLRSLGAAWSNVLGRTAILGSRKGAERTGSRARRASPLARRRTR